jgi:acyl carrier protein
VALTRERLLEWLRAQLGRHAEALTDDLPLFSTGHLNSRRMLELVTFIERESGIRMKASELRLDNLDTVARILAYAARQSAPPP